MKSKSLIAMIVVCIGALCAIAANQTDLTQMRKTSTAFASQQEYQKAQNELRAAVAAFKADQTPRDESLVKLVDAMTRELSRLGEENVRLSKQLGGAK